MAEMTDRAKRELERLRSKHPDYEAMEARWQFFLQSYEGGPDYVSEATLFRHQREHQEDYRDRLARAYFTNYCQPLVDFVPEFIFSQGVSRQPPKEIQPIFDNFIKNVDRCGTSIDAFMEIAAEDSRIFGHTWIAADLPEKPDQFKDKELSLAEAESLNLLVPYFYHVRPLEVLDWVSNQLGQFIYLKRRQTLWEKFRDDFRNIERYTEWYEDRVEISKVDITDGKEKEKLLPKETIPNRWGIIPFVPFFYRRSKKNQDLGVSFLTDIAYQNRAVFNQTSYLEEFLARQCFNVLAMEQNTVVPTRGMSDGRIGTSNVIYVPRDAKHRPEYISPPIDPAEFIQEERANVIQEMYRQAAQDVAGELLGTSADAQKQSFARTIPMIAKAADRMQSGEQALWGIWCLMQKKKWEGGTVSYRDDYSITNLQDLLLQLSTIFNNLKVLPPSFVRAEWKRIIQEFDGKLSPDVLKKAFAEIDKLSDEDITMGYKLADVKATTGVPSTANLIQGREQRLLGTDKRIAARQKSRAGTKEANPDASRRAKRPSKGA